MLFDTAAAAITSPFAPEPPPAVISISHDYENTIGGEDENGAALPLLANSCLVVQDHLIPQCGDNNFNILESLFASHAVKMSPGQADKIHDIDSSIESLQQLIKELTLNCADKTIQSSSSTCSPGFMTKNHNGNWTHQPHVFHGRYETLAENLVLPLPTVDVAIKCFTQILQIWIMRRSAIAAANMDASKEWCSCATGWKFVTKKSILFELANNTLEQLMTFEADECLRRHFINDADVQDWTNNTYAAEKCPSYHDLMRSKSTPYSIDNCIALLPDRHEYVTAYCNAALSSRCTIDINLCYVFGYDPLTRYILLDLLPFVAKKNNVQLRIICDLMTMESMLMKSALQPDHSKERMNCAHHSAAKEASELEQMAFLNYLPQGCPPFFHGRHPYKGILPFWRKLYSVMSSTVPNNLFQLRWWCTRDAKLKYPIKNHIKCNIFDGHQVICGGSNLVPVVANIDCDIHLAGNVAEQYQRSFDNMWSIATSARANDFGVGCLDKNDDKNNGEAAPPVFGKIVYGINPEVAAALTNTEINDKITGEVTSLGTAITLESEISSLSVDSSLHSNSDHDDQDPLSQHHYHHHRHEYETSSISSASSHWIDDCCSIAFVQSCPSSDGDDAIFRHILGAVATSHTSIVMCMGHCNVPLAMSKALACATERGVSVKIIVNSMYTCDLRGGQRDLFLSIKELLRLAPKVEVHVTALPSQIDHRRRNGDNCQLVGYQEGDSKGMFLHSKYVVIDSEWSAVGSWNMWTRGSFYEMESEVFIFSKPFAAKLEQKFEAERNANTLKLSGLVDCDFFCPRGCGLCKQFGPFFSKNGGTIP